MDEIDNIVTQLQFNPVTPQQRVAYRATLHIVMEPLVKLCYDLEFILDKDKLRPDIYKIYLGVYLEFIILHPNKNLCMLLCNVIVNTHIDIFLSINYNLRNSNGYIEILSIASHIKSDLILGLTSDSNLYCDSLKLYLLSIKDVVNKKELEDHIINNHKFYTPKRMIIIFLTLDLNFDKVIDIIREREPGLLDQV